MLQNPSSSPGPQGPPPTGPPPTGPSPTGPPMGGQPGQPGPQGQENLNALQRAIDSMEERGMQEDPRYSQLLSLRARTNGTSIFNQLQMQQLRYEYFILFIVYLSFFTVLFSLINNK